MTATELSRRRLLRATGGAVASMVLLGGVGGALALVPPSSATDEFDALRRRWRDMLTGGPTYDRMDPDIERALARLDAKARSFWDSMEKSPSRGYLWSDLARPTISRDITNSYRRLREMARSFASTGSAMEGDPILGADLSDALDWLYLNRSNERVEPFDNWWDWEIGIPMALNDIVVLLYDILTPTQIANYLSTSQTFSAHVLPTDTGANRVWRAATLAVRGIVARDSAQVAEARDGLSDVFAYVTSGDGFYRDGSFIQHERHPYTGGYGKSLLVTLADLLHLFAGSSWDVQDPNKQTVHRWVHDSFEPVIYRGAVMDMVRGREISRSQEQDHAMGHAVVQAIIRLTQTAPEAEAAAFRRMVKYWIGVDTYRDFFAHAPIDMILLARQIMTDPDVTSRGELVMHKQFPSMDRVVHLRSGFGLGISMSSSRVFSYENNGNGENLKGWFTGDGMLYLYNADLGHYSDDFWATVDPHRLPGTTVDTQQREPGSGGNYLSPQSWVGGAELLGTYGVAGMDLAPYGSSLRAKKSWFMFDDEIVALGAGITGGDGPRIETIIENRRLRVGSEPLTVDGTAKPTTLQWAETMTDVRWIHLEGTGSYYFPGQATVLAERKERTGSWGWINVRIESTTEITRNYLTLWLDHGREPEDATYAYVLLPNKSAAATADYVDTPHVAILSNTADIQAVEESELGITAANFWTAGSVQGLTVDVPASIILKEGAGELVVAVSDPTHAQETVVVELDRSGLSLRSADPTIAVEQLSPTIRFAVRVSGSRGVTHTATFASGTVSQIAPQADAFVRAGAHSMTNFGNDPILSVKNEAGENGRQAFMKFELAQVTGPITSARLHVYAACTDARENQTECRVHDLAGVDWVEDSVTWDTRPPLGRFVAAVDIDSQWSWRSFDLSDYIRTQAAHRSIISVALVETNGLRVDLHSREHATNHPFLELASAPSS